MLITNNTFCALSFFIKWFKRVLWGGVGGGLAFCLAPLRRTARVSETRGFISSVILFSLRCRDSPARPLSTRNNLISIRFIDRARARAVGYCFRSTEEGLVFKKKFFVVSQSSSRLFRPFYMGHARVWFFITILYFSLVINRPVYTGTSKNIVVIHATASVVLC